MKFAGKILFALGIVAFLMMYSGCKKHQTEPEPITDQQLDLLTKAPWKVTAVTLDGVDKKSDYANFQLTMTGTKGQTTFNFTTSGRPSLSPWPASGNFTFDGTNPATTLSRNDTPPVSVTYAATATNLTMSFQFSGNGYTARIGNVKGVWNFTFSQ
jgi:hypothetical protein